VRVLLQQQAPICRRVASYWVRATGGVNVLRVRRRFGAHGQRLEAGTYRFVGTVGGVEVLDVRVRYAVTHGVLRVRRDHLDDVCSETSSTLSTTQGTSSAAASPALDLPQRSQHHTHAPSTTTESSGPFLPPILHALNPANASPLFRAIVFALLAGAILLLTAGTVPERVAVAGILSRRRPAVTLAGVGLLVAAALLALFG
jgi:hypothetical protein